MDEQLTADLAEIENELEAALVAGQFGHLFDLYGKITRPASGRWSYGDRFAASAYADEAGKVTLIYETRGMDHALVLNTEAARAFLRDSDIALVDKSLCLLNANKNEGALGTVIEWSGQFLRGVFEEGYTSYLQIELDDVPEEMRLSEDGVARARQILSGNYRDAVQRITRRGIGRNRS